MISKLGPVGAGLYGFFNRLLIPTGLHHALNSVFWFDVAGINDIGKFWGTVSGGIKGVTGMYQAGFFPVMMFGLPAAAIAIYQSARPERKNKLERFIVCCFCFICYWGYRTIGVLFYVCCTSNYNFIHALLTGIMLFVAAVFNGLRALAFGRID